MAENPGTWPSKRGPIAKIVPSDVYKRAAVPFGGGTVVQFLRFRMSSGKCWLSTEAARFGMVVGWPQRIPAFRNYRMIEIQFCRLHNVAVVSEP